MNAQGTSDVFWSSNVWGGGGVITGLLCVGYAKFMEMVEFSQEVIFDAPVVMNSNLLVKGDLTVEGDLIIEGAIAEDGDVHILGSLEVNHGTTLNHGLTVYGTDDNVTFDNHNVTIKGSHKVLISGDSGDAHGLELTTKTYVSADLKVNSSGLEVDDLIVEKGVFNVNTLEISINGLNFNVVAPTMTFTGVGRFIGDFEVKPPITLGARAVVAVGTFIESLPSVYEFVSELTPQRAMMAMRTSGSNIIEGAMYITRQDIAVDPEARIHLLANSTTGQTGVEMTLNSQLVELSRVAMGAIRQFFYRATTNEDEEPLLQVNPPSAGQPRTRQMSRKYRSSRSRVTPGGVLRLRGGMPEPEPDPPAPPIYNFEVYGNSHFIGVNIDINGDLSVEGVVEINGNTTITGLFEVVGASTFEDVNVVGVVDILGNTTVTGALEVVEGGAIIAGGAAVAGGLGVTGAFGVAGVSTFTGDINIVLGAILTDVPIQGLAGKVTIINSNDTGPQIQFTRANGQTSHLRYKNSPAGQEPASNIMELTTSGEFHVNAPSLKLTEPNSFIECEGDLSAHGIIRCQYYYKHSGHNHITIGADGNGGRTHVYIDGQTEWRGSEHSPIWTATGKDDGNPQYPTESYDLCCKAYVDSKHDSSTLQTAYTHGNGNITLTNAKPVSITQYGVGGDPPSSNPSLMVFKDYLGIPQMIIQSGGLQFPALGAPNTTTYQELAYLSGVTSAIQTQLNNRLLLTGGLLTGALTTSSTICGASNTELGYLVGVTSLIQTQLNNRLLISGGDLTGALTTSSTICGASNTELSYSAGVTSSIQTQLTGKGTLSGSNTWTGSNTFNTTLPTSTLTPTTSTQFVTKTYVDNHPGTNLLTSNNTWTGTNVFSNAYSLSTGMVNAGGQVNLGADITSSGYNNKVNMTFIGGDVSGEIQNSSLINNLQIGGHNINTYAPATTYSITVTNNIGLGGDARKVFTTAGNVTTVNNIQIGGYAMPSSVYYGVSRCENYLTFGYYQDTIQRQFVTTPSTNFGTLVAGVFFINNAIYLNPMIPLPYSIPNYNNITIQDNTSGDLGNSNRQDTGISAAGEWGMPEFNDLDAYYYVRPNFGLIVYANANYSGTVRVNFKNTTKNPVFIKPSTLNTGSSCKIFYRDLEQISTGYLA